ncbi:LysR family transcriptional regulator [Rhizobium halophytocola]|uniref:DNA-binding transcriptional LysR family regulator n=1 Tax=Rhizobium halophytocola TaxID=735519 RepID=A0ABS4E0J0_9HYPH|nr:LysR family transcriptional regulator [Rhizobium halophytocola]MBP1851452.1 DNA-binding transcriptional LysR family regulator [Rhizobium halophytocola]
MIELRHLRYAIVVADEGHMTRAAERLGLQQPPLSQQIRALEDRIGTPLFRRLPRGMALTEAGEAFIARARQVVADVEGAVDAARRAARGETGKLVIGFTSSAGFHPLVASVVRAYGSASPDVSLTLEEGSTAELIGDLLAERLDAAFVRSTASPDPRLTIEPVWREDMVLALPDTHRLAQGAEGLASAAGHGVALADLAGETFVLYRRQSAQGLYDLIITACHEAGFSPRVGQETPRFVSTLSLVAAGLGLTIIPRSLARLETSGVSYRRILAASPLEAPLSLAYRGDPAAGALKTFIDEVRRQAKASPAV